MNMDNITNPLVIGKPVAFSQAGKADANTSVTDGKKQEAPEEEPVTDTVMFSDASRRKPSSSSEPQHSPPSHIRESGDRIKQYYEKIEPVSRDKETNEFLEEKKSFLKDGDIAPPLGALAGIGVELGIAVTGANAELHEHAHGFMVEHFYKNPSVDIQVDGTDNLKNLIKQPSFENLGRVLTGYDLNKDGAAGVTRYTYGDGLNETGKALGENKVHTLISAAGSISEEIPALMGFAAGFKLRKKHPVMGYALMTVAGVHHLAVASYPFSALTTTSAQRPGHDWAKFAELTGIPPIITALAFGASMPILGVAMWLGEKKAEEKIKDRLAVGNLVRKGEITPDELTGAYARYSGSEKMNKAENQLMEIIDIPVTDANKKDISIKLRKAVNKVRSEYDAFGDFVAKNNREKVDEEKKQISGPGKTTLKQFTANLKNNMKESWDKDKVGTALTTGTLAGAGIVAAKSLTDAAAIATGSTAALAAGSAMSYLLPGVSLLGTAAATYRASKVLQSPDAGKMDKAAAVSTAAFSALCSAGTLIPGLGAPLVLTGIAGMLGTYAVKTLAKKLMA